MDKITGITYNPDITGRGETQTTNTGDAFQKTLEKTLNEQNLQQTESAPTSTLSEISVSALNPITSCLQSSSETVVQKTDSLLNLLDQYSRDLNDPGKNLKEIAPLIETIKTDAQELMNEAQQTLAADDALNEIATQCAVTANVEYLKFERGDYL